MTSIWSEVLHQASFGGIEFDCLTTSDALPRALIRRTAPRRNGGRLQDMGSEPRTTQCRILFFERKPLEGEADFLLEENHIERFRRFVEAAQLGRVQDFVHPITGTYRAMVEDFAFDADAEAEDQIEVSCTFVEDSTQPTVFEPGAGGPFDAGVAAVKVQGAALDADLAAAGIDDPIGSDTADMAETWSSDPLTSVREVNLQLASLATRIDDAVETYELATNVDRYPAWRNAQILLWKARQAAESFRQTQPQLITVTLAATQPLRVVLTDTYGAADAESQYDNALRLNDIDDPTSIRAGTQLRLAAPNAGRRVTLRRTV